MPNYICSVIERIIVDCLKLTEKLRNGRQRKLEFVVDDHIFLYILPIKEVKV